MARVVFLFAYALTGCLVMAPSAGLTAVQLSAKANQVVMIRNSNRSTLIKGQAKLDEEFTYKLRVGAGQRLFVELDSNEYVSFNVTAPGASSALFRSSQSEPGFSGLMPSDGFVTIKLSSRALSDGAAKRNYPPELSNFSLRIMLTGTPMSPLFISHDALTSGTRYSASITIPCKKYTNYGRQISSCEAALVRRSNNGATLTVTNTDGEQMQILFVNGKPVATDRCFEWKAQPQPDASLLLFGTHSCGASLLTFKGYSGLSHRLGGLDSYEVPNWLLTK